MPQLFNNNINSLNTTVNVSNTFTVADDRSNILAWLSPLDPRLRHQDIRNQRVENVGEWILRTEEFRNWYATSGGDESDKTVLFCSGNPGVGKTFISSLVIDRLCDKAREQNATVACFYFDFAAQKEQTATNMLGALLKQLVYGLEETPEEISRAYRDQRSAVGGRGPLLSDIVKMMETASCKKRTFICIDALDECVAGHRVKLLDSLNQVLQKSPGTRIFVTGRPHIRPEIGRRLAGRVADLFISPKRDDIIAYLHTRLAEDTTPDAMDSSLEAGFRRKFQKRFLKFSLNIDAILQEPTVHRRRQKLSTMTNGLGLGGAYGATLERVKGQGGEKARLGMTALMWVSHSERPLKASELCQALAVEIGSPDVNTDNISSIGTLLACCQGLVTIDKEASIVRLIHFTLQEYLRCHPELFGTAHSTMAETCLSYLNSRKIRALSTSPSPNLQDTPFLEYSSLFWGMHAKKDLSDCAKSLALKLLDDYSNHISSKILLKARGSHLGTVDFDTASLFSGLHCAAFFGISEIVAGLVRIESCDINQNDCVGNTPLVWAAHNGHGGVVNALLQQDGINPDKPDTNGRTPLFCAAENGYEGVVKQLLRREDVNPDKPDNDGQTPLSGAALCGHEGVVKILLGRDDINPNKPNCDGQTPLWLAAWKGRGGVVKLLLGRDGVDPDAPDGDGRTPLWWASWNVHEGVVKILLGRDDVDPDASDNNGRTPLSCAAMYGHEEIVRMLLGRNDVNPNKPDGDSRAPLWWAAWEGHKRVVGMLLGWDNVNPNTPDNSGRTPLNCAAVRGHEGMVRILLRRDDVNPNKPDVGGGTPLWRAAWKGHEGVVKILLGRDGVNHDQPDNRGRTPLSCAAVCGHGGVVKILLGRDGISPNRLGNSRTLLGWGGVNPHKLDRPTSTTVAGR